MMDRLILALGINDWLCIGYKRTYIHSEVIRGRLPFGASPQELLVSGST